MKKFIKSLSVFVILLLWFVPKPSFSAEMFFQTEKILYGKNENFVVKVFIDTESVSVNAVEGKIVFNDILEIKEIRDGNSSINFWIEKPVNNSKGEITFSGITAGGFTGQEKFLFSIIFSAKQEGKALINFDGVQVLKNDGIGTGVMVKKTPLNLSISNESNTKESVLIDDSNPPEDFKPSVGIDPSMLGGKYFVVFSTQDKGVGIDHYEIREGFWGEYVVAESPYLLTDQGLTKKIYIKAIDKNKNERVVTFAPQNYIKWYQNYLIISIIILLIIILFLQKKWRKNTR